MRGCGGLPTDTPTTRKPYFGQDQGISGRNKYLARALVRNQSPILPVLERPALRFAGTKRRAAFMVWRNSGIQFIG